MFHATGPNRVVVLVLFALLVMAACVLLGSRVLPGGAEDSVGAGQAERVGTAAARSSTRHPGAA